MGKLTKRIVDFQGFTDKGRSKRLNICGEFDEGYEAFLKDLKKEKEMEMQ